ncbi:MAG: winged helix-turn-helix domain-containing protein [Myxococcota bacterium]
MQEPESQPDVVAVASTLEFGPFVVDTAHRCLSRDGVVIDLQPLAYELLEYGAQHPGQLLSRDALQEALWPDVRVTDHSLTQLVHRIRKALGEHRQWWKTVPKRGYRFEAAVKGGGRPLAVSRLGNSFHGRVEELKFLSQTLLGDSFRAMLIHGPGGSGKTRLAMEWLDRSLDTTEQGIRVELASAVTASDVLLAMAKCLAVDLRSGGPAAGCAQMLEVLAHRQASVVLLDNLEQLDGSGREIVENLLRSNIDVAWLGTSRDEMGSAWVCSLHLPPLSQDGSAALFRERAQRAGSATVDESDPDLRAVLARLEGSPLAIELAAARVPLLGMPVLRQRLQDAITVLSGRRTGPVRHRSMVDAIRWSYELLPEHQRNVLLLCSLFPESFTAAQVENACSQFAKPVDALDVLQALREQSLLAWAGVAAAPGRLRLLIPVREFCREVLNSTSAGDELRPAWHGAMVTCLHTYGSALRRWEPSLVAELGWDLPAMDAALAGPHTDTPSLLLLAEAWACVGRPERSLRVLQTLGDVREAGDLVHWELVLRQADWSVVRVLLDEPELWALGRPGSVERLRLHATCCGRLSNRGELERALAVGQQALDESEAVSRSHHDGQLHLDLAITAFRMGRYEDAKTFADAGLDLPPESLDPRWKAELMDAAGSVRSVLGEIADGLRLQEAACEAAAASGRPLTEATTRLNLATRLREQGQSNRGFPLLDRVEAIFREVGASRHLHLVWAARAETLSMAGRSREAREQARLLVNSKLSPGESAGVERVLAGIEAVDRNWDAVEAHAQTGLAHLGEEQSPPTRSLLLLWLAVAQHHQGQGAAAQQTMRLADALPADEVPNSVHQAWAVLRDGLAGGVASADKATSAFAEQVRRAL